MFCHWRLPWDRFSKTPSGNFHACFRFGGKRFKRSLKTTNEDEANSLLGRIEDNARLAARGKLHIPEGADIPTFLLSDGQLGQPLEASETLTLSETEQMDLWDCLFLSVVEIAELLAYVKKAAQQPFIHPMVAMAAHTGARRSELIQSQLNDFGDDTVVIRERKRARGKRTTRRVPLSPFLRQVMSDWFTVHPGGPFTFCQPGIVTSENHQAEAQPLTRDEAHDCLKRTLAGSKWATLHGWHVLRHSFISNFAAKGVDQRIIDSFVGHTTEAMRRRYTHLFPSSKKAAIELVFGVTDPQT